jgi:hypothetical protein
MILPNLLEMLLAPSLGIFQGHQTRLSPMQQTRSPAFDAPAAATCHLPFELTVAANGKVIERA